MQGVGEEEVGDPVLFGVVARHWIYEYEFKFECLGLRVKVWGSRVGTLGFGV